MKQLILGTAGHIDHGKTSMIRTVTGTDTDRLKEEKLRGITIELGFAALDLPSGRHVGVVDVPGHEKFVKNMVAGATGIDVVAMVIAADEGVMPQTREHLEICALLGIQHGMVVLTKIDMVDEEWLELVKDDVAQFVAGTFLEGAPVIEFSSATGKGVDDFISTLDTVSKEIPDKKSSGIFRLPVDRVFTMKGFGTVITGTLVSGKVSVGDTVRLYPSDVTSKVRGLQVHNDSVETAEAGVRTAINFQGLDREAVVRGEVVARNDTLKSSYMVDGLLEYLKSNKKPLKNRTRLRFHTGSSEVMGILILLDREELVPGESAIAQFRLETPVALVKDDRFVVRSYSPVRTVGGGRILNPIPPKHKRFKQPVIDGLKCLVNGESEAIVSYHLENAGYAGVTFTDLLLTTNLPEKQLNQLLQSALSKRQALLVDKEQRIYLHGGNLEKLIDETLGYLKGYHKANPLKSGIPKEELKSKIAGRHGNKVFTLALNQMAKESKIAQEEDAVRLADHKVSLAVDQEKLRNDIQKIFKTNGLTPPYFREVVKTLEIDGQRAEGILHFLLEKGKLVKIKDDLYYDPKILNRLKNELVDFLKKNGEITTPQFKDMTGASRKYVIPLLEYFDAANITIRVGDIRQLRGKQH